MYSTLFKVMMINKILKKNNLSKNKSIYNMYISNNLFIKHVYD